jgi:putative membrane protein
MHRYVFATVAALALACTATGQNSNTTTDASATTMTDGQIVGVLHTINQGEIQEAQRAANAAVYSNVVTYAKMMVSDHTAGDTALLQAADSVAIAQEPSDIQTQLQSDTTQQMQTLDAQSGAAFDQTYVGFQVQDHEQALQTIDATLLPNAQNAVIRQEVQSARDLVAKHLQMAQSLAATQDGGVL